MAEQVFDVLGKLKAFTFQDIWELIDALDKNTHVFCQELLRIINKEMQVGRLGIFVNLSQSNPKHFILVSCWGDNIKTEIDAEQEFVTRDDNTLENQIPFNHPDWNLYLPIMDERFKLIAVLAIGGTKTQPKDFNEYQERYVRELGFFLDKIFLKKGFIDSLGYTDHLTGLWNKRGWREKISADLHLARLKNPDKLISVAYIDLDGFSEVNAIGHDFGDLVIVETGSQLRLKMRDKDYVIRDGGDEFILIMEADVNVLHARVKDIQQALMAHEIHRGNKYLPGLTFSVGITKLLPGELVVDAVKRADKLLIQSKEGGGAKITIG